MGILNIFLVIIFFLLYNYLNIFVATFFIMIMNIIIVFFLKIKTGKFKTVSVISMLIVLVCGGATLFFKNEIFIKWKVSIVYWLIGCLCLFFRSYKGRPLLKYFIDVKLNISDDSWLRLGKSFSIYFIFLGFINLFVAYTCDTTTWVYFKLFGLSILSFIFFVFQYIFVFRKIIKKNGDL